MSDTEKKIDEIIEETMQKIYDDINSSDDFEMNIIEDDAAEDETADISDEGAVEDLDEVEEEEDEESDTDEAEEEEDEESDTDAAEEEEGEESDTDAAEEEEDEESDTDAAEEEEDEESDTDAAEEEEDEESDTDEAEEEEDEESDTDAAEEEEDEESDTDEAEEEEDEESDTEQVLKKHRRKKKAAIIVGSIIGVIAVVYIGFAVYFGSHFIFRTTINGVDFSMKSAAQVEQYMKTQVAGYSLTLEEKGGNTEIINGNAISLEYVPSEELKKLVADQNNFFWIEALWKQPKIEAAVGVKYNKEKLSAAFTGLQCLVAENQVASVDAHPEFKDTEFVIVPEVVGTQIDTEKFQSEVEKAINGFQETLNLEKAGCYIMPRFLEDSKEVSAARDAMNSYLGANITYDFSPNTEIVDASVISQWVKVDADMNVTFDQEAVRAYIASLAEKYDTKGRARQFTTANGNVVTVEGGTYGWQMDQEAEYNALTANIQNAETVTREPEYSSRGATHDAMDVGNTYVEVDLSNQYMWYFQNGQVVLETPVVTGAPTNGRSTPAGVFSILEMMRNKVLRGNIVPETGEPEYETPVSYWMRVTWSGVGFHDATWQSSFGGNRYRNGAGSHGCINMPYNQAGSLYSMLSVGTPVVIHY